MYFYEDEEDELRNRHAVEDEPEGEEFGEEEGGEEDFGEEGGGEAAGEAGGGEGSGDGISDGIKQGLEEGTEDFNLKDALRQGAEDAGFIKPKNKDGEGVEGTTPPGGEGTTPPAGEGTTPSTGEGTTPPSGGLDEASVRQGLTDASNNENNPSKPENKSSDSSKKTDTPKSGDTPKTDTPKAPEAKGGGGMSKADKVKKGLQAAKEGASKDGAKGAAKEVAKEAAKEAAKEVAKKAIQKSGFTRFLAMIPPIVLFWAAVIIVAIIIIIGFLFFILSMPGQVTEKLRELGLSLMQQWQALMDGSEDVIDTQDIAKVANYLESMGYDIRGEGFVSSAIPESALSDETDRLNKLKNNGATYDEAQGVWRDENDKVVDLNSDPIMTYIVSDNLCYIIKNFNQNLDEAGESGVGFILGMFAAIVAVVVMFTPIGWIGAIAIGAAGSFLAFATAGNPNWGTGLISIWHESGGIGGKGSAYDPKERGYIELDPATKKLEIKRGWTNNAYTYDVDGWSGRYGMPLEFLLSVHIATKMPDLAMDMAVSFETDVTLLLRSIDGGEMIAGVKVGPDKYLTWSDIRAILETDNTWYQSAWNATVGALWNWITGSEEANSFRMNANLAYQLMKQKGMPSADSCKCCACVNSKNATYTTDANGVTTQDTPRCQETDSNGNKKYQSEINHSVTAADGTVTSHIVCEACITQLDNMVKGLKQIQDNNWNSYTPYISKVTDHWFRDVYFVIDNPNTTEVVKTDEEYLLETNERWTMYETYKAGDSIPEGFAVGDYKLYEYNNGTYTLSTKTKAEVDELNEKIAKGDTTVSKLVKKSLSEKLDANYGSKWTAYQEQAQVVVDWEKLEVSENSPAAIEMFKDKDWFYYKEIRPGDILQVEEGQRGVTNTKIKNMFINNKYYKYDGTVAKAKLIEEDRAKTDRTNDNKSGDQRNEELLAKVSLAKDSLAAFSMLQNTKTLDADYIYRDFKELIVELDYFDKEDLSDKVATVMQWMLPETGASGWPIRKYEKGEAFYGTLINSEVDLRLLTDEDIKAAERIIAGLDNEVATPTQQSQQTATSSGVRSVPSITLSQFIDIGYEVHKIMEDDSTPWDYCIISQSQYGTQHMKKDCNDDNCGKQHCDSYNSSHVCGLNSTIQDAVNNHHNTCCATYVSWVLKEAGFDLSKHPNMHGAQASYDWCKAQGWQEITDYSQLEGGDLFFNNGDSVNDIGHVQMMGNDDEWLNTGGKKSINDPPYKQDLSNNFIIGMRSPLNAAKPFVGYQPGEVVVSPVTGKVIEHGTVTRKNEETGKYEDVEFIKIEVIHEYLYDTTSPKGEGYKDCTTINHVFEEKVTNTTRKDKEGYDYFYDEYQGVIDGFVLYIEGIDLTLFDSDGAIALVNSGDKYSEKVTRYEPNAVADLVDDLREAQTIWQEDAKAFAIPVLKVGEDIYIKEGTVIGKTMKDEGRDPVVKTITNPDGTTTQTMGGNGNYIRLILRDYEDAIVEDVESYFIIKKAETNLTPQPYEEADGDLELLAKFLHKHGCEDTLDNKTGTKENAQEVSRAIGYTVLNRAITNYNNYGVTLTEQINAPGQYSGTSSSSCDKCIKNADWCLSYDCTSVYSEMTEDAMNAVNRKNKTTNVPMTRDIISFYGTCKCTDADTCWWWVDVNGNNAYDKGASNNDIFFCVQ